MSKAGLKYVLVLLLPLWVLAQEIQIFSPLPGEQVSAKNILIAASFFGLESINPTAIQLKIDGRDVSQRMTADADMLSYVPVVKLTPGSHTVTIRAGRLDGGVPYVATWSFRVVGAEQKVASPLKLSGKTTAALLHDNIDGNELNIAQTGLNLRGEYNWFKFFTNLKLTTEEDPLLQARNRYAFGMQFGKVFDLNFGDTNPRLSRFILNGKRVRGVDANLKLGFINFHLVRGEVNRAIQGSTAAGQSYSVYDIESTDSSRTIYLTRKGYTFQQDLIGGRLSFGSGQHFNMGFSLLKVREDISSVKSMLSNARITLDEDTLGLTAGDYTYSDLLALQEENGYQLVLNEKSTWAGAAPRDNIVIGSDFSANLDHRRIAFEGEFAFSMLNQNIWDGAMTKAGLDTLLDDSTDNQLAGSFDLDIIPVDPADIASWFIINQNIYPLAPIDISVFSDSSEISLGEAIMKMPSLAYRLKAIFNYFDNYFTVEYSRVGPKFYSLANPYLLRNNREIRISDRVQLFKNRLMLTVIYSHQDDNVLTTSEEITTQNTVNVNATVLPGPGLPTFTISMRVLGRDNGVDDLEWIVNKHLDTLETAYYDTIYTDSREDLRTTNFSTTVNYRLNALGLRHDITGTIVSLSTSDLISDRGLDTDFIDPGMSSQVFSLTVVSRFRMPLKTVFSLTTNGSKYFTGPEIEASQRYTSTGLTGEYGLLKNRLKVSGGVNLTAASGKTDFTRVGFKGGVKAEPVKNLLASVTTEFRTKKPDGNNINSLIARANLSYIF